MSQNEYIKNLLARIPETPGVYQYFDDKGTIIYVGKAKNLKRRVNSYFQKEHETQKTRQLVKNICDIKYVVVDTEQDALLLENNLIKQYQPHYNILLKDGKSYPSICITKEDYPRIFKTRKIIKSAGEYYGPYSFGNTVDLVIELIHKLYPIRTCNTPLLKNKINNNKYKVCLKYHLHNCCGICEQKVEDTLYSHYIEQAKKIIAGDAHEIIRQMEGEMKQCAEQLKFEQAQLLKEKLELLEKFQSKTIIANSTTKDADVFGYEENNANVYISMLHIHNGSIVQGQTIEYKKHLDEPKEEVLAMGIMELRKQLGSTTKEIIVPFIPDGFDENLHIHIALGGDKKKLLELAMQNVKQYKNDRIKQEEKLNPDQRAMRVLGELQQRIGLPHIPVFIDSFDNSHLQGSEAVAGCVVFRKAKPSKNEYKRFKIQMEHAGDDYAAMREIVRRRYTDIIDENGEMPDLIIADGGIGQMNAIREVTEQQLGLDIPIVGLKKDDKHRTNTLLFGFPPKEVSMKITDDVFRLMVQIQDEVHRFAITYHKNRRSKAQIASELNDIQGVGEITKQKLLQHFKSVKRIQSADLDELKKIIGTRTATNIYGHFHPEITH